MFWHYKKTFFIGFEVNQNESKYYIGYDLKDYASLFHIGKFLPFDRYDRTLDFFVGTNGEEASFEIPGVISAFGGSD